MTHPYMNEELSTLRINWNRRDFIRAALLGSAALVVTPGMAFAASSKKRQDFTPLYKRLDKQLNFQRKSVWSDADPIRSRLRLAQSYNFLTVHHEGQSLKKDLLKAKIVSSLQNIQAGHRKRRYGDIAYHFIIDPAGRIWEGRSLQYQGAHVAKHNVGNVGVMLLGNFEKQNPSTAQITELNNLVGILRKQFRIKRNRIYGHCDLASTLCPGGHLYPHIAAIRKTG